MNVANALHYASDHLPVKADFTFTSLTGDNNNLTERIKLHVFPNPSSGKFNINYSLLTAATLSINVVDLTGKIKLSYAPVYHSAGYFEEHNDTQLEPGIYIVRFEADDVTIIRKLVILE